MSEAPRREARKACWDSRDEYFKCLDASQDQESTCKSQKASFEKNCAASWVDYFVKRRQLQKRQDAMYARDAGVLATQATAVPNAGRKS